VGVVLRRRGDGLSAPGNLPEPPPGRPAEGAPRDARRLARLRAELVDELVPLPIDGPAGPALLAELDYALHPPIHEGRIPTYGAVVTLAPTAEATSAGVAADAHGATATGEGCACPADLVWRLPRSAAARPATRPGHLGVVDGHAGAATTVAGVARLGDRLDPTMQRTAADGRATFLWRTPDRPDGLVTLARGHEFEADLVELREQFGDVVVVQRDRDGRVRAVTSEGVIIWNLVEWVFKPVARRHLRPLLRLLPGIDTSVLAALFDLCVHWLSAAGVGATLVWWLDDDGVDDGSGPTGLDRSTAHPACSLSVADRRHHPALLSLLSQMDRAAVVRRDGELIEVGVGLVASAEALERIAPAGGTRHSSARRYAYDQPRSVVFVVSSDGPVTVFSDGASAAQVRVDPCRVGLPAEIAEDADAGEVMPCPSCGRQLLIDVTDVPGWTGGPEQLDCPVCGGPVTVNSYRAAIRGALKPAVDIVPRTSALG
jgi:hypothetical protein